MGREPTNPCVAVDWQLLLKPFCRWFLLILILLKSDVYLFGSAKFVSEENNHSYHQNL